MILFTSYSNISILNVAADGIATAGGASLATKRGGAAAASRGSLSSGTLDVSTWMCLYVCILHVSV